MQQQVAELSDQDECLDSSNNTQRNTDVLAESTMTAEFSAYDIASGGLPSQAHMPKPVQVPDDRDIKPRFVSRCVEVAHQFGLSERETQIMILYAKGRSYTRIQEELYISRGTLTTHLRHIYQKMDVHNKQEFLDLIEQKHG